MMKRRDFVKTLGLGGIAAGGLLSAGPSHAAKRVNWKMVTTWPPNFPIFQEGVERFAKDVRSMSGGKMSIQTFAAGELIPAMQSFEAVSQGTVEMSHGAAYYWAGKIPAAQFFTAVPFGMNAQGMNAWLISGGGLGLWHALYEPHGLIAFPMGNTGVQMGGWFRKKINSLADLKGLKMRIPGLGGKVIAKAGVNPVLLAGGEIYTALERGTIDATEWVGPFHDMRLGLHRAAKYYYYPGWQEPGPTLELNINLKAWKGLPRELQLIVQTAAAASNAWMAAEFQARNIEALRTLRDEKKVEILPFPDDVLRSLRDFTKQTLDESAEKDAEFKKVYDAYRKFSAGNEALNAVTEVAYARINTL